MTRATALRAAGRFAEAERACRHAIGGYEAVAGPRHPRRRPRARRARPHPRGPRSAAGGGPLSPPRAPPDRRREPAIPSSPGSGCGRASPWPASIARSAAYDDADRGYAAALRETRRRFGPRDPMRRRGPQRPGRAAQGRGRATPKRRSCTAARSPWSTAAIASHGRRSRTTWGHRARPRPLRPRRAPRAPVGRAAHRASRRGPPRRGGRPGRARRHRRRARPLRGGGPALPSGAGRVPAPARRSAASRSGSALASLAAVEQQRGRVATAPRALYHRRARHSGAVLGGHHVDVAMTVNNLAVLERDAGNLDRAR